MKKTLALALLVCTSASSWAQSLYPFKPFEESYFKTRIQQFAEDADAIVNVFELDRKGHSSGRPSNVPWSGSFWPLNQGMIASPYQDRTFIRPLQFFTWEGNVRRFNDRREKYLSRPEKMSDEDLAFLAPSEKYDLLLGDLGFDLSTRIWDYAWKWGDQKRNAFLTSIDLPGPNYEVPEANRFMALWEGICHGWALAAAHLPEPKRPVTVKLQDGREVPFYPDDIKALVSLLWANSLIQDNVKLEGNRCWVKRPKRDDHGRYYDAPDRQVPAGFENVPGCGDIHPGMFHLILSNIMGKQKRSYIVDIDPTAPIANQPASGYRFTYFNVENGEETSLDRAVIPYSVYRNDPFKDLRSKNVAQIVGVMVEMEYADWYNARMYRESEESKNDYKTLSYIYDLELDRFGNVIGGQWRVSKSGRSIFPPEKYKPDFIWVAPRDFKRFFTPVNLSQWSIRSGKSVPADWKSAAKGAHSFVYKMTREFGFNEQCRVVNRNNRRDVRTVPCEYQYPKPQPLIQVVDQLMELSTR